MSEYSLGLAELGTAVDMGGLNKGIDAAESMAKGGFSKIGDIISGAFKIGIAGAITGIVALGVAVKGGIDDARASVQLMAETETIIKNTGGAAGITAKQVADLATSLSDAEGKSLFGDDQIQGAENVLLRYKELKGIIPDVTQLSVDMAQNLGTEPAAAAKILGLALQKPFDAEAKLAKQGIVLTDAQNTMLASFKATGDTAGAQKYLIDQLNTTYGGSALAAAQAAGGTVQFQARLGEAAETVGNALLPLLDMLGVFLNTTLAPAIEAAAQAFSDWFANPATQEGIQSIGSAITSGLGAAFTFLTDTAIPALLAMWAMIQPALQIAGDFIIGTVIPAIGTLATWLQEQLPGAIAVLTEYWNTTLLPIFSALVDLWLTSLQPALSELAGWFAERLPPALSALAELWSTVLQPAIAIVAQFIAEQLIPRIGELVNWLRENLPIAIQTLSNFWTNTLQPAIATVYAFIVDSLIPTIQSLSNDVFGTLNTKTAEVSSFWTGTLQPALNSVWEFLNTYIIPIFTALGSVVIALVKKEIELLSALWTGVLQPALKTVWDFIDANIVPILSALVDTYIADLKIAIQALADLWTGTLQPALAGVKTSLGFVADAAKTVIRWFGDLASAIDSIEIPAWLKGASPPPLADWLTFIGEAASAVAKQSLPALGASLSDMASVASQATSDITDAFLGGDIGDMLIGLGEDAMAGFADGLHEGMKSVVKDIDEIAKDIEKQFEDATISHSPSQMMVPIGQSIMQGIMQGMADQIPGLTTLVGQISADLIDDMKGVGRQIQDVIGDAFGSTATIDRQIAANLDKLKDVLPRYRQFTEGALKEAQLQAQEFLDPVQGAKFFKLRSNQILEYAALQKELSEAATQEDRERLEAQMLLINAAQTAEINAFRANQAGAISPAESITDKINAMIAEIGKNPISDEQIHTVDMLAGLLSGLATPVIPSRTPYDPGPTVTNNVTVTQLPGEDAEALARRVVRIIEDRVQGHI